MLEQAHNYNYMNYRVGIENEFIPADQSDLRIQ